MELVVPLGEISAGMRSAVGGKAVNLGVLGQAGFPVPRGFCVTTDAYRALTGDRLDVVLAELATADTAVQLSRLALAARTVIAAAPFPAELPDLLRSRYRDLGSPPVAVRSSATAEDLEFASFAGQQDTFLNICSEEALLDAVRRCWASLWTDRAVSYRSTAHVDHRRQSLAVIVQEMVQPDCAGVMFTANPVTGNRHQAVVDASPGLGEAVVSGKVNPDHWLVDTVTSKIIERRLGDKRLLIRSLAGGGTEQVERQDAAAAASLSDAQVLELVRLGERVQQQYGCPQDIEWALDAWGLLWLTQTRPVTTLYPCPDLDPPPATRVYLCLTLAQGLTRPITPMGLASFRLAASSVASAAGSPPTDVLIGPRSFHEAGQRAFLDVTGVLRNAVGRRGALTAFGVMEARAAAVLCRLAQDPELAIIPRTRFAAIRPVARVLRRVRLPQRVAQGLVSPRSCYRAIAAVEEQLRRDLVPDESASPSQHLDCAQQRLGSIFLLMLTTVGYPIAGFAMLALARRLLRDLVGPGELQNVLRSLPHNVTTEMDLELWRLTTEIRSDPPSLRALTTSSTVELLRAFRAGALPTVATTGLTGFLDRHGHRAVAEIDLGMPRWSDDPSHLLGVVQNYLRLDDPTQAPDVKFAQGSVLAEATISSLVQRVRQRGGPSARMRAAVVDFALHRVRQLAGLREAPKNLLVLALAGVRRELMMVGSAVADEGGIAHPADIFFLDVTEAREALAGVDHRTLVQLRRDAYAVELGRRHIPRVLLADGTEPEAVVTTTGRPDGALVGSPASTGLATGPARVILDPVGARLEPGEVLVAPSTDPGWTPLFLTAGGLVMEMGGSNSHGAVVAREYGIPAVVGVPDATSAIATGVTVRVDGAAGLVFVDPGRDSGPT